MIFNLLIQSIYIGSILAVGAFGLSFAFGVTNFINFAYGEYMVTGVYSFLGLYFLTSNIILSVVIAVILVGILGLGIANVLFYPIREQHPLIKLVTSFGLGFVLRYTILAIGGSVARGFPHSFGNYCMGGLYISSNMILSIVLSILVFGLIFYLLFNTEFGEAARALADNRRLATIVGIDIDRVENITWFLTSLLAGVTGILLFTQTVFKPSKGILYLFYFFVAVIVGGIGKPKGALVGGYLTATVLTFSSYYVSTLYGKIFIFSILVITLLFKPEGIFEGKMEW